MQQNTKLNHELHRGVPFSHKLSVKRGRQNMYSTTSFSLKTHISKKKKQKKRSQQIQIRDIEGPFDHICSPPIAFSVGTSQYKVAIRPFCKRFY